MFYSRVLKAAQCHAGPSFLTFIIIWPKLSKIWGCNDDSVQSCFHNILHTTTATRGLCCRKTKVLFLKRPARFAGLFFTPIWRWPLCKIPPHFPGSESAANGRPAALSADNCEGRALRLRKFSRSASRRRSAFMRSLSSASFANGCLLSSDACVPPDAKEPAATQAA